MPPSSSEVDKLKKAKTLRNTEINRIRDTWQIASEAQKDTNIQPEFIQRYRTIDTISDAFAKQHNIICSLLESDEEFAVEDEIRKEFESKYFSTKAIYYNIFEKSQSASPSTSRDITHDLPRPKLPEMKLSVFSGDLKSFTSFLEVFNAIIYNNTHLSPIEKFSHLINSLEGDPKKLVARFPLTSSNFESAYQALKSRYSSKRLLATYHWNEIENSTRINSSDSPALRTLLDTFNENIAALKNLNYPVDSWNFILANMFLKRLPSSVVTSFETQFGSNSEMPDFNNILAYVEKCCTAYETITYNGDLNSSVSAISNPQNIKSKCQRNINSTLRNSQRHNTSFHKSNAFFTSSPANKNNLKNCAICNSTAHAIYTCPTLLNKTPIERFNLAKDRKLCVNCLSNIHKTSNCNSESSCRTCKRRHHTLFHFSNSSPITATQNSLDSKSGPVPTSTSDLSSTPNEISPSVCIFGVKRDINKQTEINIDTLPFSDLLPTIRLRFRDAFGNYQIMRAVLDSGSEACYISRKCVNILGLSVRPQIIDIFGLGTMKTRSDSGIVQGVIVPLNSESPQLIIEALVLDQVCTSNMPVCNFNISDWEHIKNINLADHSFNISQSVDMILNASVFNKILLDGKIPALNSNVPDAINTLFGYILMGDISSRSSSYSLSNSFFTKFNCENVENVISKFWALEEINNKQFYSDDDTYCEDYYTKTTFRLDSGRYVVSLPFKNNIEPFFENSRLPALRRFLSLEKKLKINPELKVQYSNIIQEYIDNGHLELADQTIDNNEYFIPHHCVFNPHSVTSPIRIVFDASCKDSNHISLNDCLLKGPKLQKDISAILLNFRLYAIAITADIKAMYRQIQLNPKFYKFQKIFWRFSSEEPVQEYVLKTVTFGVNSSPFLALRTINQLANDEKELFPHASKILLSDNIFVDDICTGCNTVQEATNLQYELSNLLLKGGFELRKWSSNNNDFLKTIPEHLLLKNCINFDLDSALTVKILGLKWNPTEDSFSYSVTSFNVTCTKRNMLSELARIYDPLGFLTPVTLLSKLLIQNLWSLKLNWDDVPPPQIIKRWELYKSQLPDLLKVRIPRYLFSNSFEFIELCGFCDGSQDAYAACIYVRLVSQFNITTSLLCAKSKVAPLKRISIPRVELCAALLLTRLFSFVLKTYSSKIIFKNIYGFTDSTIVLQWLQSSPHRFKPFVANRIAVIQEELPNVHWLHVSSSNNAADPASRGIFPSDFVQCSTWWTGPDFLKKPQSQWPLNLFPLTPDLNQNDEVNREERKITLISRNKIDFFDTIIMKYSSLPKLQRIMAYIQKFIYNIKNPEAKNTSNLNAHDLNNALLIFIKHVQYTHFHIEIENYSNKVLMSKPFRKLGAFVDEHGFFRVGGRLKNSLLNYEKKYPLILPRNSRLTELIIEHIHKSNLHPGLLTTQYLLSQNFWILSARRAIKHVLSKCISCFRSNPSSLQPLMGNLPATRISQVKPFSIVGIDFGGPFLIKTSKLRNAKLVKSYICIFVCFTTKAIHIELASDLSTDNFLCALRRFIARRGRCSEIISDNGTNFSGANKYLRKIFQESAGKENIKWSFNPPSASHFGGLYEAGIKSVKTHFSRVIGSQCLTYEEMNTLLIQIESLLNSRPLCPQSSDPNDYTVLTPGHFLTLEPLSCIPDPDLSHIKLNRLDRYQLLLRLHRDFWVRWHREYLNTLQQRTKWLMPGQSLSPGSLVLIKNENAPPITWKIGRVRKVFPGKDNIVRVAEVQTSQGLYVRPLVKLCPLPNK